MYHFRMDSNPSYAYHNSFAFLIFSGGQVGMARFKKYKTKSHKITVSPDLFPETYFYTVVNSLRSWLDSRRVHK